ncbi:hypothetical protein [Chitinophaga pinensis]|uniref:hypothetical protein n=1 Tax=Chitinophaga pinensis TaxID=79329 RepID=UPI0021BD5ABA|nr:hypothetical protein [Chitinophaga pinensis]
MWHNPLSAGGFLWDFADQGIVRKDLHDSLDTDHHRGADGIVGPHHEKEGSFFTIKEIWSPVHMERREITPAFDGILHIENRYAFTNLNQCTFSARLAGPATNRTDSFAITAPDIAPFEKGRLQLQLPANWNSYDVLYVTASDKDKRELFTWSFPVVRPVQVTQRNIDTVGKSEVFFKEADSLWIVSVNNMQLTFNKYKGLLKNVSNKGRTIPFNNGPILQEGENNFAGFSHHYEGKNLIISSAFDRKQSYNTLQWIIYPSGIVKMTVHYFPAAYFTTFAGVNFSFPESDMVTVDYMGDGPYRVWKNRLKGTRFGVWHKDYNNTETGELELPGIQRILR